MCRQRQTRRKTESCVIEATRTDAMVPGCMSRLMRCVLQGTLQMKLMLISSSSSSSCHLQHLKLPCASFLPFAFLNRRGPLPATSCTRPLAKESMARVRSGFALADRTEANATVLLLHATFIYAFSTLGCIFQLRKEIVMSPVSLCMLSLPCTTIESMLARTYTLDRTILSMSKFCVYGLQIGIREEKTNLVLVARMYHPDVIFCFVRRLG